MQLEPPPGLGSIRGSLDEFKVDPLLQQNAMTALGRLANTLNTDFANRRVRHVDDPHFSERFHRFMYWSGVDKETVRVLLDSIRQIYPTQPDSYRRAGALIEEISSARGNWDVAFGDPATATVVDDFGIGMTLHAHNDSPSISADGAISFKRSHTTATAYFTNIRSEYINLAECDIVERYNDRGWIPGLVERMGAEGVSISEEIQRVRTAPANKLHSAIRSYKRFHFSAKSLHVSDEYLNAVFATYQARILRTANPILLIDFVKPTGEGCGAVGLLPILSYYWPGRKSIDYQIAIAGGGAALGTARPFNENVRLLVELIRERMAANHLITEDGLKQQVSGRCESFNESDYRTAISRFTALNSGQAREATVLSHDNLVYAPEDSFAVELELKRNAELADYVSRVNERLIDIAVGWPPRSGMNQVEFIRYIKAEFPNVFFGDAIRNRLWPEYERRRPAGGDGGYEDPWDEVARLDQDGMNTDNTGVYNELIDDPEFRSRLGRL